MKIIMKQIRPPKVSAVRIIMMIIIAVAAFGCGGGGGGGDGSSSGVSGSSSPSLVSSPGQSVSLSWEAPTTNSDGSSLDDLSGYKIYYGTSSGNYSQSIDVGDSTSASISSLSSGTWCFAVTAYDTSGNESSYSDEVCI
jgi:hypothetical protein